MSDEWRETTLGQIVDINPESTPKWPAQHEIRYIDIASVSAEAGISLESVRSYSFGEAPGRARRWIRAGDVLVSTVRPNLRAFAVVPNDLAGEVASTGFAVLRARPDALPGFIWSLVQSDAFVEDMVGRCTGSNYPAIRANDVAAFPVMLPPLPVQRRIVDVMAHLDDHLANLRAERENAQGLLEALRFALLSDPALERRSLGHLLDLIVDNRGKTPTKLGTTFSSAGMPVISAINVKSGRVVPSKEPRFIDEATYSRWMKDPVKRGDVLLTSEGPLGEVALIPDDQSWVLGQRLFGLRGHPDLLDNGYLFHWLCSRLGQSALNERSSGSTVKGIRQSELVKTQVPWRPVHEQRDVAAILNEALGLADSLEREVRNLTSCRRTMLGSLLNRSVEIPRSFDSLLSEVA